jgi:hypothetical protein
MRYHEKKTILIVIAAIVLVVIVCGYGGLSAMKGGRPLRFLTPGELYRRLVIYPPLRYQTTNSIRKAGIYGGVKIVAFDGKYIFLTEDGRWYGITPQGNVVVMIGSWMDQSQYRGILLSNKIRKAGVYFRKKIVAFDGQYTFLTDDGQWYHIGQAGNVTQMPGSWVDHSQYRAILLSKGEPNDIQTGVFPGNEAQTNDPNKP